VDDSRRAKHLPCQSENAARVRPQTIRRYPPSAPSGGENSAQEHHVTGRRRQVFVMRHLSPDRPLQCRANCRRACAPPMPPGHFRLDDCHGVVRPPGAVHNKGTIRRLVVHRHGALVPRCRLTKCLKVATTGTFMPFRTHGLQTILLMLLTIMIAAQPIGAHDAAWQMSCRTAAGILYQVPPPSCGCVNEAGQFR
jgi:hypothetical protein